MEIKTIPLSFPVQIYYQDTNLVAEAVKNIVDKKVETVAEIIISSNSFCRESELPPSLIELCLALGVSFWRLPDSWRTGASSVKMDLRLLLPYI